MKLSKILVAAATLTIAASGSAFAFHDGGAAYCDGCHTMHNSSGGKAVSKKTQFTGVNYLLQGSDQSSTCLNCHGTTAAKAGSYHIMTTDAAAGGTVPSNYTPGGDFAWVKESFTGTASYGAPVSSPGDRHGHNINAVDYGFTTDATLTTSPGGSYPAANLHCSSCHDPHGKFRVVDANGTVQRPVAGAATGATDVNKSLPISGSGSYGGQPTATEAVGVYRLLAGAGYQPDSVGAIANIAFSANPPVAVAPSAYNRSEATTETRVAYGTGMSEWCANCHAGIHNTTAAMDGGTSFVHPASSDSKLGAIATNYNAYVSSGNFTGTQAASYTSMVPFEEGVGVTTAQLKTHAVNDGSQTGGPTTGNENVMCLSCHRAHASGWDSMTRWNNKSEFLTVAGAYPGVGATGEAGYGQYNMGHTQAETQAAFYQRPATNYATYQRSLCNKCHAKD